MTEVKDWNEAHLNGHHARTIADFIWEEEASPPLPRMALRLDFRPVPKRRRSNGPRLNTIPTEGPSSSRIGHQILGETGCRIGRF